MITVVGSLKGGSGKSTVAFNLAVWLAMAETDVTLLDLDPQATLSDVLEVRSEERYEPRVRAQHVQGLVASKLRKRPEVVIDVGTADIDAMKRALQLADRVVIPVPPSQADIWSTQRFVEFIGQQVRGTGPELVAFINRADTHRAVRETDEAAAALVALKGVRFIKPRLAQRTIFRRSFSEGLGVFELEPRGKGAREFTRLAAALYPAQVR